MIFKPQHVVGRIPAGNYQGTILEENTSPDERYLWLKIAVDGIDEKLNIAIPTASALFHSFASLFANKLGEVDTSDFVDTVIEFAVKDKEVNGTTYSRFSKLEPIMEEEYND